MDRSIQNCNVCVVGGAGFLGSHLVNHLIDDLSCQVLVLDNLASGYRSFVHPQAEFIYADITGSESFLRRLFIKHRIEYVFNYAASPYLPVSFERPLHVFNINAFGALKVINAAYESGCKAILQVSSAEIYGDQNGKINEDAPVNPHSSYGASKAAIDSMVQVRWKEARVPVISLRQFNCVGERETHPYVIPEIIGQLARLTNVLESGAHVSLGNNSYRDFQYAGDAVRMATELLEKGEFGEVYNMGSEGGVQIYDLAKAIGKLMGFNYLTIATDTSRIRPWEIWHLQSDNSKLYSVIESRPGTSLEAALALTIADFYSNGEKWCWE